MSDFRLPPLRAGERVYRALLYCYPARFRRAFARELVETFRDERRAAERAGVPTAAFWLAAVRDVLVHGLGERLSGGWRALRRPSTPNHEDSAMAAVPRALRFAELRFANRRLRRDPSFSLTTTIVLALGIGATTAVFSVVRGVLLDPLPYPEPDRLVAVTHTLEVAGAATVEQSDAGLLFYQRHARAFQAIGGWRDRDVNLSRPGTDGGRPERVPASAVTANLFEVFGVPPVLGRGFGSGEDRVGAAPVVVLAYDLWRRLFDGDASAIGRVLVIDGVPREIVGVMPREFTFVKSAPQLWIPERFDPAIASAGSYNYRSVGRLRPGTTVLSARADLERILPGILDEFPSGIPRAMFEQAHLRPVITPLRDYVVGDVSRLLWILLGSVSLVLLIACANVASLFLVRGESRQLELAVRGALGCSPVGMMTQALSESVVLAAYGGALGVLVAAMGVRVATAFGRDLGVPRLDQVGVDSGVLLFALGISTFCATFVGLIPVLRARRTPIGLVLREAGRANTAGARRQVARSTLVVGQVALALVLIVASGLLARSFVRLRQVRPGFDAAGVVMARLVLPDATYPTSASMMQFYERLLEQVRALPGVRAASLTEFVPLSSDYSASAITVEDHPIQPNAIPRVHDYVTVDAQYFNTLGIPLVSGRMFGPQDPARPAYEVIVSHAFAEHYWPGASPLGKRIHLGVEGPWLTIVGEVGDVHYDGLDKPASDAVYYSLVMPDTTNTSTPRYMALLVDAGSRESSVAPMLQRVVHGLDPSLPIYDERPLSAVVSAASARARTTLLLLALASGLALVLGAVGIYGVISYGVSLRRREIGVRIALGARPAEVASMISRHGVRLAMAGIAIGVVCALGVTRLLRGLLYEISPTDPLTLAATSVALLAVAFLASWIPARRAAAIDPSEALRRG